MEIFNPTTDDAAEMWELARDAGLDLNSSYSYLMMSEYFSDSCAIARDGDLMGFVTGFVLRKTPDTLFVWQVAVDERARGQGLAKQMIDKLIDDQGVKYVEATITPQNRASIALFKSLAEEKHTYFNTDKNFFDEDTFPTDHESEMLVRVGPIVDITNY